MADAGRAELSVADHVEGVRRGDRAVLARTITLIESRAPVHADKAAAVLAALAPAAGGSIRVGITGVPGVGKSTFIEALGMHLIDAGHRVAVLAVDPSSTVSRGSILGDKTRMERLSREPRAYIRPSPTAGTLGGVTRRSRETILVCEAAGFDVVLVETVGVGQSEVAVRSMVDAFLLLMLTGAGDELQGIKKGVIELADAIVVHKADGDNLDAARRTRADFESALRYLAPATEGWTTRALTASSVTGEGVAEVWETVDEFVAATRQSGAFERRRRAQVLDWLRSMVEQRLVGRFEAHDGVRALRPEVEAAVLDGRLSVPAAVDRLLERYES
ncbi:methylmalonyl Co-A mutase-associated GTPase MeaB [Gaopeijia maritima]|uniref:methylmalonyl Co-A mutase-associated GTPase MeaB n=1 Tax=Gaopeijia maritima TaxID=3119007 RepID=UPI003249168C